MDFQKQRQWMARLGPPWQEEWDNLGPREQAASFAGTLTFGTAGIRAKMGWGPARLNDYTVARTAWGIGAWLTEGKGNPRCAIGYDTRFHSEDFARLCARVLAQAGVSVYVFDRPVPTPMVSFAVRKLSCGAGIVISASHNTKEYNGIKCYGPDGGQMTGDQAARVLDWIGKAPAFFLPENDFAGERETGHIRWISPDLLKAYYQAVREQLEKPERLPGLKVVYTPLCGAGWQAVPNLLESLGVQVHMPPSQAVPSGAFASCPIPNPEEEAAFCQAYRLAEAEAPAVILATDPDCDRLAAAEKTENGYRKFTGNELGCLLLDYLLSVETQLGRLPERPVAVCSLVSTPLADAIAQAYGCRMVRVLTGFKYIGQEIEKLEHQGRSQDFVFGFEESCGFLKGSYVRDKDGVLAAALVCQMVSDYRAQGLSLQEKLQQLYARFGYWETRLETRVYASPEEEKQCLAALQALAGRAPATLGQSPVVRAADYRTGVQVFPDSGRREPTGLPRENMVGLWTKEGSRVFLRPSGTEPKLKLYYGAPGEDKDQAGTRMAQLRRAVEALLPARGEKKGGQL